MIDEVSALAENDNPFRKTKVTDNYPKLTVDEKLHYLTLQELLLNSGMYEKRVQHALAYALDLIEKKGA